MENVINKNFTDLDNAILGFVREKKICTNDVVIYAIIHSQNKSGYDTTGRFVSKIFNISTSTITNSTKRLEKANLIEIKYGANGRMICTPKLKGADSFIKIPNGVLYSKDLHIKEKSFLICVWNRIVFDTIPENKTTLHTDLFSSLGKGRRWVSGIVDSLIDKGIVERDGGKSIKINISKVIDISDSTIDHMYDQSVSLIDKNTQQDNMLNSYEKKTGIPRGNILDWNENGDQSKTIEYNSPKWMLPVIEAINTGAECLNKKPFVFNTSQFSTIGKWIKEIVEKRDGESEERCMNVIIESIKWKASQAARNDKERVYYTAGFFSRTTKNNIASNLYHFEEYRSKMACPQEQKFPNKKTAIKKEKVTKRKSVVFNYGTEL